MAGPGMGVEMADGGASGEAVAVGGGEAVTDGGAAGDGVDATAG